MFVIHHLPGWDSGTKEITRRFAASGYNALCPNLYARQGLDVDPDDAAAATREAGGVPDEQFVGDAEAAVNHLRALPTSNGKVGVIGYCSGGRHSFLTAVSLPVDAAVDCYGAFVVGTPPEGFPLKVTALVDRTPQLHCPLLGLFGNDDQFPTPEHVDELEAALKEAGKDVRVPPLRRRRPRLLLRRPHGLPARGGRRRLAAHLRVLRPAPGGLTMCSYLTVTTEIAGSAKGAQGWFSVTVGQRLLRPPVPRAVRPHAQHRLRRPVPRAGRPRGRRAERGVGAAPGRQHRGGLGGRRGRRLVTAPTAPAAGVHLPWARVPGAVRAWAARLGGGGRRRRYATCSGGFSPGRHQHSRVAGRAPSS